jgi:hypothetical protein
MKLDHTKEYKPTVQVRKLETVELHDFLNIHVPIGIKYVNRGRTFCRKCGAPIESINNGGTWKSTTDVGVIKFCMLFTQRYNDFAVSILSKDPSGALFLGTLLGMTSSENRRVALTDPEAALRWATTIDKSPSKDTWEAVRYYPSYSKAYMKQFNLTDKNIRNGEWTIKSQLAGPDSLPRSAANL